MWFNGVKDFRIANTGKGGCVLHIVKSIDTSPYTASDCEEKGGAIKSCGSKRDGGKEGWRDGGMEGWRDGGKEG